jgi:hypothetical protein
MGKLAQMVLGLRNPTPLPIQKQTKDAAYAVRAAHDGPYLQQIMTWIEEVANKPVAVGVHAAMIESVGRSNAYREILQRLKKDLETAERILADDQQRQRGR